MYSNIIEEKLDKIYSIQHSIIDDNNDLILIEEMKQSSSLKLTICLNNDRHVDRYIPLNDVESNFFLEAVISRLKNNIDKLSKELEGLLK